MQASILQNQRPIRNQDRKSTRLNSSHGHISYAVFCLKKKIHGASPDGEGSRGHDRARSHDPLSRGRVRGLLLEVPARCPRPPGPPRARVALFARIARSGPVAGGARGRPPPPPPPSRDRGGPGGRGTPAPRPPTPGGE